MSQTTPITRDVHTLRQHAIGKKVAFVQIYGINSLKTMNPTPDVLAGRQVVDLAVNEADRHVTLDFAGHIVAVDLARTGTVVVLEGTAAWTVSGGGPMPTARVVFDDATGIDFREPAKTKRITLTIRER